VGATPPRERHRSGAVRETRGDARPEPGVLCWNCRCLTPFQEERCQSCGAAFAGNTGGAFATSLIGDRGTVRRREPPAPSRTLADLISDLQRVHDVARDKLKENESAGGGDLFQCPSCGRFVSETASGCLCGVKFATSATTFACPECDSIIPALEDQCPVCHVQFADDLPRVTYACPRCGSHVSADAARCACGVWFED